MNNRIEKIINLFDKKLFKEALIEIEKLFKTKNFVEKHKSTSVLLYNIKGLIFKSLDLLDKSEENFLEAIKLNPKFYPAIHNLGLTYFKLGQYDKSMKNYKKATDIKPDYPDVYNDMGTLLMHQQKFEEAIKKFTMALKYNPVLKNAYSNLIKSLPRVKFISDSASEFIKINNKLRKKNYKYNSTYKIYDEDVKQLLIESFKIIPKNIINLDFDDEQIFRENKIDLNCKRHFAVFNKYNIIPENCFGCYKVLIEPKNVLELIKLYLVFDNLKLDQNYIRKCMIETRPNIKGCYKGYIFCSSIKEAQIILHEIDKILKKTINENISATIKRGCSEFAESYPNYAQIDNGKKALNYNHDWKIKENEIDKNYPRFAKIKNHKSTINGINIHDMLTVRNWLSYSKFIGDQSYKKIIDNNFNSIAIEKKMSNQTEFRKNQYLKLK